MFVPLQQDGGVARRRAQRQRPRRLQQRLPAPALVMAFQERRQGARLIVAAKLPGEKQVLVEEIGQLRAHRAARRIEDQRGFVRALGALVGAVGVGDQPQRLAPQRLAPRAIRGVEGAKGPAPQQAHVGVLGLAGAAGHGGVVQVGADMAVDLLSAMTDHLHHAQQRQAGAGQQAPSMTCGRIVLKRGDERRHGWPALRRIGLQPAQDRAADPGWHLAILRDRLDTALADVVQPLQRGVAPERACAIERLVKGHAEAELVGARVGRLIQELLGRHIGRRPHDGPGAGQRIEAVAGDVLHRRPDRLRGERAGTRFAGQTEVDHPGLALLVEEHVLRLEIAVNQPRGVSSQQPPPGRDEDREHLAHRALTGRKPASEGAAAQEVHGQEDLSLEHAHVVHCDHVRVRQSRQRLRLTQKTGARRLVLDPRLVALQQLERDLAIQFGVVGAVDDAHRTVADAFQDHVAADPGGPIQRRRLPPDGHIVVLLTAEHGRQSPAGVGVVARPPVGLPAATWVARRRSARSSAAVTSAIDCGRWLGFLASIRATRATSQSGVCGATADSEGGVLNLCAASSSRTLRLANGNVPAIISNSMQPSE